MNIVFFNQTGTLIFPMTESISHKFNLIFFDDVVCNSVYTAMIKYYVEFSTCPDATMIAITENMSKDNEAHLSIINKMKERYPLYKKLLSQKHKDKLTLLKINALRSALTDLRKIVTIKIEGALNEKKLFELIPFYKEDLLKINLIEFHNNLIKEDTYLSKFAQSIIDHTSTFSLDEVVERMFTYSEINLKENKFSDFISIPLWNMPPTIKFSYEQLKYTRIDLWETLNPFKNDFKKLAEQLFKIPYLPENLENIKQLCHDKLLPYNEPIRTKIDESLYMVNQKNKLANDFYVTFTVGVAPIEFLVDFYEKSAIILPYMASEIKERVSRHFDLKSSFAFIYYKIHLGNKFKDFQSILDNE